MKKAFQIIGICLLALLVLAGAYVGYVFLAYHRIEDRQTLAVQSDTARAMEPAQTYTLLSWNIGFGAYTQDFSFFMDGGTQSWAESEPALQENLTAIGQLLTAQQADLVLLQEVDVDSTRTYHVDEREVLLRQYGTQGRSCVFAQNYDSPFLLYPFTQPHGASKSGLVTAADFAVSSAQRRSLPLEGGFRKLLDLDRCYSVSRIPVQNGKELCLYNLHLSAYTSDGSIADEQLRLVLADMQA